jgi:glycosyltransferase involved in cell wall biosynthesis
MPRSVLEAMAMGRAVLTTDVPGCRETVEDGQNGYLVPARDAGALADGMLRMLAQPGRLEEMGRQSRTIAEERFDVHSVNRAILGAMGLN